MTKSGFKVFGFCPAGSTCKVDLILERCLDVLAVNVLVVVN